VSSPSGPATSTSRRSRREPSAAASWCATWLAETPPARLRRPHHLPRLSLPLSLPAAPRLPPPRPPPRRGLPHRCPPRGSTAAPSASPCDPASPRVPPPPPRAAPPHQRWSPARKKPWRTPYLRPGAPHPARASGTWGTCPAETLRASQSSVSQQLARRPHWSLRSGRADTACKVAPPVFPAPFLSSSSFSSMAFTVSSSSLTGTLSQGRRRVRTPRAAMRVEAHAGVHTSLLAGPCAVVIGLLGPCLARRHPRVPTSHTQSFRPVPSVGVPPRRPAPAPPRTVPHARPAPAAEELAPLRRVRTPRLPRFVWRRPGATHGCHRGGPAAVSQRVGAAPTDGSVHCAPPSRNSYAGPPHS
jgi:hypothetical protein